MVYNNVTTCKNPKEQVDWVLDFVFREMAVSERIVGFKLCPKIVKIEYRNWGIMTYTYAEMKKEYDRNQERDARNA